MKRFLSLLFLPLLLVSCTAELNPMTDNDDSKSVFYASVEGCGMPETKVYADATHKMVWNADDLISLFEKTTYNDQYKFMGEDGDTAGDFEMIPRGSSFVTANDVAYYYAVYPYVKRNKLNNDGSIQVTLPAEQAWKEHSFGVGANTMVAISEDKTLAFKNVGGYLQLRLYGGDVNVSQITLAGNNGEKIAGKARITVALGETPVTLMDNTATTEITLVCNPAMKLGTSADQYTEFWFVVPPVTFSKGFTVTVTDDKKNTFTKQTSKSFTVTRNQFDWMNPILVDMD